LLEAVNSKCAVVVGDVDFSGADSSGCVDHLGRPVAAADHQATSPGSQRVVEVAECLTQKAQTPDGRSWPAQEAVVEDEEGNGGSTTGPGCNEGRVVVNT